MFAGRFSHGGEFRFGPVPAAIAIAIASWFAAGGIPHAAFGGEKTGDSTSETIGEKRADSTPRDVSLGERGTLAGQIVDSAGRPAPGRKITLTPAGGTASSRLPVLSREAVSDSQGRFAWSDQRAGLYWLESDPSGESSESAAALVRIWTADAAPPAARAEILLAESETLRGARRRPWRVGDPLLRRAFYAGAIAAPILIYSSRNDSPAE